jgi:hypothetical protein
MTIQSPSGATFQVRAASPLSTSPNPSGQAVNSSYKSVYIQLPLTAGTSTVTVSMAPYVTGNTPPAVAPLQALSAW